MVQVFLKEQDVSPWETYHFFALGLFSGYGTKIGEWLTDSSGGVHVPFGLYFEFFVFGYVSLYWIFAPMMVSLEVSYEYRIQLTERIRVGAFGGFSRYDQGPEPIRSGIAAAAGLHLEVKPLRHLQLNTRVHGTLPIYRGGSFINPFASALLYITVGAGYAFID